MRKILVAIDGSKHAEKAMLKAKELAELGNGSITLLNVIDDIMVNNPYIIEQSQQETIEKAFVKEGQKVLNEAVESLKPYSIKVNTELRYGEPGRVIIEMAEKEGYDLVVMGNRGLNAFSRAMLGSKSNKVVNHIHVSVLIVK